MLMFQVREPHPDIVLNTMYFWVEEEWTVDGDWKQEELDKKVLFVSGDRKFAKFDGRYYRVCELGLYDEIPQYVKVWYRDPFQEHLPEYMPPLPPSDSQCTIPSL